MFIDSIFFWKTVWLSFYHNNMNNLLIAATKDTTISYKHAQLPNPF